MFNIGPEEIILILVIAIIFVGPKRLPDMARQIGKGLREFRSITSNAKRELMDSVAEVTADPEPQDGTTTPMDVESLPPWDGATDGSQAGDLTAASNGAKQNGSSGAKPGKPKKKSKRSDGAPDVPTEVARADASGPAVAAPAPSATPPAVELPAPATSADDATTEIPTTDPVEP
jgi:sec-independent protein translocase protein TatB